MEPIKMSDLAGDAAAYDFQTIKSAHAFRAAESQGFTVVLPELDQLQLDIDSADDYGEFRKNWEKFEIHVGPTFMVRDEPSKSGDPFKRHITLRVANHEGAEVTLTPEQRILYQLFLGSDRTRELLSYIRVLNGDDHPTLFIEKPDLHSLKRRQNLYC